MEYTRFRIRVDIGSYRSEEMAGIIQLQDDLLQVSQELWAGNRQELVPRFEGLLVIAKDQVRFTRNRVNAGTDPPQQLNSAEHHRLKVEAALWKALRFEVN